MNDTEIAAMVEAYRRVQGAARRWSGKLRRAGYQEAAARLMATTAELGEAMRVYQAHLAGRIHLGRDDVYRAHLASRIHLARDDDSSGMVPEQGQAGASDCRQTPQAGDGAPATVSERADR